MAGTNYLTGKFLLAMPTMLDPRFERAVIYLCSHDSAGAWGLIVNRAFEGISFTELLEQLEVTAPSHDIEVAIHSGGPVEPGRGFVLHRSDYVQESTLMVNECIGLTATVDILKAIAEHEGPQDHLIALGYAGWGENQLEQEIQDNAWMIADGNDEILFHTDLDQKWPRTMAMLGIDISMLSSTAGHA